MKIKILHLEDTPADAEMVERELNRGKLDFEKIVVSTKPDFIKALNEFEPDIVISDHDLPSFNSIEALEIVKKFHRKIPVILVTGTISEDFAVDIMKKGASDYILKDRLQRLPDAIINVMEKCKMEAEREKHIQEVIISDALFQKAEGIAHFGLWESDLLKGEVKGSAEVFRMFGYEKSEIELTLKNFFSFIHPNDRVRVQNLIVGARESLAPVPIDYMIVDRHGNTKHLHTVINVERNVKKEPLRMIGFNQDITEEKEAKMERDKMLANVIQRNNDLEQFNYIVSHNLRAPVANIIGLVNMLKNDENSPVESETIVNGLSESVIRLDSVILDMNKILQVRSAADETREKVSFTRIVEDIKKTLKEIIVNENVEIITDFKEVDTVETLKSFIYSIFLNLISNSIKFRQKDKTPVIKITSYRVNNKVYLAFNDNGRGIDLSKSGKKIFGLYNRFHPDVIGTGLGLFMVKTQVEALNGKVSVISGVNKGTEFKLEFDG